MARIFFSYSHDDESYRDRLEKHLAMLRNQGLIEVWHDRRIAAGSVLDDAIDDALEASEVVLLLVTASFLASDYCYSREMKRALERHELGEAVVIPVIVQPCDWEHAPFGNLLAAPKDGRAITTWPNMEEAYADVARQIRTVVEKLTGASPKPPSPATKRLPVPPPGKSALPRSSNLRLRKEFSELDRDRFLRDAFEYVARFFEGSLQELENRSDGVNTAFQRVDGNTFTAAIYRGGKKISECSVHTGSGGFGQNSIAFSFDTGSRGRSMNESLSVDADDQSMFLTSMGIFRRSGQDHQLSQQGGAELFWQMLIDRLQ